MTPHPAAAGEAAEPWDGWLFLNPDTGVEWSANHPVESGECQDAQEIRQATLEVLRAELFDAWAVQGEVEHDRQRAVDREAFLVSELAEVRRHVATTRTQVATLTAELDAAQMDAERYRWLRSRNLDAVRTGGIFIGVTPDNLVINEEDADQRIDAARAALSPSPPAGKEAGE